MLLRMYQRWCEGRGWKVEVTDALPGETAGIKSATMLVEGKRMLMALPKRNVECIALSGFPPSIRTKKAYEFCQRGCDC